ncbi:MAG TPA: protein kinase, partial [Ktedonobacteraceae bacterium]|nr:protein kinase [Ktedonobacteraceae bacterium]
MIERAEQRLGNYRLIKLLGKGSFSDVYLGEHLYLCTPVAIKVLRSRMDSLTLDYFLTEARNISHLIHPHIIRVFDFGMEAEVPFLVMDYAPYGNLGDQHPPGSAVPLPAIVSYVQALASALQHAHDQYLVHGGLKPENVLLGSKHEVLLSDFGSALLTAGSESLQVKEPLGTLAYMAPEQIRGRPCPASDQYALAVMVYKWLGGQLPFQGSAAHLSTQHLHAVPASLHERHPEIPCAVEQVVFKALSKEPSRRYADALSFAKAFEEACQAVSSLPLSLGLPIKAGDGGAGLNGFYGLMQHMPMSLTPMVGRQQELKAARDRLARPEVRLLTLTGPGGVGKTRFATALSIEMLPDFAQNACAVWLASLSDPGLVMPTVLRALGLPESGELSAFEQLVAALQEKPFLLLLDNFEHLLSAAPQLPALLATCPQLKILVTSRAALHLQGEYEFAVPPLALPDLHRLPDVEDLSRVEAVALFLQCAEARNHKFKLAQDNAAVIAEICARLEGLPFAIELAAGRSKVLSLQALLSRLEHGLEVLSGGKQDAAAHQQTLRNTIAWSYDLLSGEEQLLFRRLSVFEGAFSLEAAEAVATALGGMTIPVLDAVASLIDKSLLKQREREGAESCLCLLGLVREYGLERLTAVGELEHARDAHARYYLALSEKAEPALQGAEQAFWLEQLEHQHHNLQAALLWLLQRGQLEETLRLAAALERYWLMRGHASEGHSFLEQALEASRQSKAPISAQVRAKALCVSDALVRNQEDARQVIDLVEEKSRPLQGKQEDMPSGSNHTLFSAQNHDARSIRPTRVASPPLHEDLTAREVEVMHLLAMGLRNAEIAERLVVSPHTVNGHVQSIYGKLGVNSRSAVTRYALTAAFVKCGNKRSDEGGDGVREVAP